ncbi:MAG: T9SS type A sorting domain-containing protein, partial [Chitinophagaceae bacterium]
KFTLYTRKLLFSLFLFLWFALLTESVFAQPTNQTFNSSGTYTIPAGYSAVIKIEAWGGGGGGGTNLSNAKGGGGGGAFASITTTLTAGNYAVTVGAGGAVATAGGNSSFTTLVIAAGGSSTTTSTGGAGGTTAASTGTTLFAGGNGGNGATTTGVRGGGGGGGSANTGSNGGNGGNGVAGAPGTGGAGGTGAGTGGNGANDSGTPDASSGVAPGSGGGGRGNSGNSKSGANGQVIVTVITILPVKFGNITAYEKQSGIQIDWTVYSEENLNHYEVEKSSNGRNFSLAGNVIARNSSFETKYGWFDVNPLPGVSFYRLKSVDIDSHIGYSSIVKVSLNKNEKDISVYPNPVMGDYVTFQSADQQKGNYSLKIFNNTGQQVYSLQFEHMGGAITKTIQLPQIIRPGINVLQLEQDGLKVMSKSLIVQ